MPGGTDIIIDMERTLRDKEVQVAHLMACVYDEQNRTQVPTAPTNQPWDPVQLMRLGGGLGRLGELAEDVSPTGQAGSGAPPGR